MKLCLLSVFFLISLTFLGGCGKDHEPPDVRHSTRVPEAVTRSSASVPESNPVDDGADSQSIPEPSGVPASVPFTQTIEATETPQSPEKPVYRLTYPRREISDDHLRRHGLIRISLKHLDLITDLTPDVYESLLPLPDAMLSVWEEYFGELPPSLDGSDYRVTGYMMRDRELFLAAGLIKENTLLSYHGRQIGAEFWLNDQSWTYYRRHLLLHEATHAFMRHLPGEAVDLPLWYLEGMAEMLATHRLTPDGTVEFNVMPEDRSRFVGLERIAIVQRDVKANGVRPLSAITVLNADDFTKVESYAWCWALCRFLDSHPKYRDRFRRIARELVSVPFRENMARLYAPDMQQLQTEWLLFAANIEHGFDFERARIDFMDGEPIAGKAQATIRSDRGWQSAQVLVEAGQRYLITATGRFTLADDPEPWVSEANGVSIRYARGRPLGQLQASILAALPSDNPPGASMLREVALGNQAIFEAVDSGTLYLRINDHWGELADNQGALMVTIQAVPGAVDQGTGR